MSDQMMAKSFSLPLHHFRIILLMLTVLSIAYSANSQNLGKPNDLLTFSGYVRDLNTVLVDKNFGNPLYDNLLHNRLEMGIYPQGNWSFKVEGRNRLRYGDRVKQFSDFGLDYGQFMDAQNGLIDLSKAWIEQDNYVLHSEIDRLYASYKTGNWRFRLGRQRINWGKNLVWNPNDLFNTYSYYDFDYEKRPGADAFRVEYYRTYSSSVELAVAPRENLEESIGALYYGFHKWQYDFQVFGGYFKEEWVGGLGWSGYIGGASFRGEMSYYTPTSEAEQTQEYMLASLSGEYTFGNSLRLHLEGIYNGNDQTANIFELMNTQGLQANNLSMFKYGTFGQVSYPVHPLVSTSVGSIYYPKQSLALLMPSVTYSAGKNWEVYVLAQLFTGKTANLFDEDLQQLAGSANQFNLLGARVQWSF